MKPSCLMRNAGAVGLSVLAVCAITPASADQPPASPAPIRDKWALVVGITQFQDPKIPTLKYATKDAADFYKYLTHEGNFAPDHVRLLLNDKATRRRIKSELGSRFLAPMAKPDDLVVLFFSTHGSPAQMDLNRTNFIVTYDTEPNDLYATGLGMQEITDSIKERIAARRVVLVLDACHAGGVTGKTGDDDSSKGLVREGSNFDAESLASGLGQMVICSSQRDERSWESKRYPNGVFTRTLLEVLRNDGNSVAVPKLFQSVSEKVHDEVQEDYGAKQNPVLISKWDGGQLIIATKPGAPEAIPATVLGELEPDSAGQGSGTTTVSSKHSDIVAMVPAAKMLSSADGSTGDMLIVTKSYFSNDPQPRKALQSAFALKDTYFNDPQYKFTVAKLRIQMDQFSQANDELKGLLVDEPNNWEFLLAKAYCLFKLKQQGLAQEFLRQAQFHNPTLARDVRFAE